MLKKVPHTYTIVFSIIIICAILTWIIPVENMPENLSMLMA